MHQSEWPSSKNLQTINAGESVEKWEPSYCLWKYNLLQPLWRTVWRVLKKLEVKLSYDSTVLLFSIDPEETIIEKDTGTPVFIAVLFIIAQTWKQPRCPLTDEWIKLWYV